MRTTGLAGLGAVFGVLGLVLVTGCASSSSRSDQTGTNADDAEALSIATLRASTNVQTSLESEGVKTLSYAPTEEGYPSGIPFEAVELGFTPGGDLEVDVSGTFPSTAKIYVVDDSFHILARGKTAIESAGDGVATQTLTTETPRPVSVAHLSVAQAEGISKLKVLVRDSQWDRPMTFDVGARVQSGAALSH